MGSDLVVRDQEHGGLINATSQEAATHATASSTEQMSAKSSTQPVSESEREKERMFAETHIPKFASGTLSLSVLEKMRRDRLEQLCNLHSLPVVIKEGQKKETNKEMAARLYKFVSPVQAY